MSTFNLGDHLVTNIDILGITEHHGIYIGNDCVIHLTAKNNRVEEDCLYIFSDGNEVRFKKSAATPTQAIARTKSMLGKKGYDLFSNNCEHFVNYCLIGKKNSNQVSNATHAITHTAARTGLLGAGLSRSAAGAVAAIPLVSTTAKYEKRI